MSVIWGEVLGEERKRKEEWSLAGGEQMREVREREYITSAPDLSWNSFPMRFLLYEVFSTICI